jgi:DNA-binding LacI/PurR family transcriptional regulator
LATRRLAYAMVDEHYDRGARWDGLQLAVREAQLSGLEITVTIILMNAVHEWSEKPELAAAYFGRPGSPTGLCAWNDHGAIRLLTVLLRAGVQVPDQVSLVGYDNLPDGTNVSPKLTSVDQCVDQQIRIALRQLTQVDAPQASHTTMVTPVMALRESTRSL